jgi:hypothetical protein
MAQKIYREGFTCANYEEVAAQPGQRSAHRCGFSSRGTFSPVPIKERAARIAALEDEVEQLSYAEEMLVSAALADGADVQRSPSAPPAAVLQVRIVEAAKRVAA